MGSYHQMDVMGETLAIDRAAMLQLAEEAEVSAEAANRIIDRICNVAGQFARIADILLPQVITRDTLYMIQGSIDQNLDLLR
jgi:serine/threonine-protein kinase HipA